MTPKEKANNLIDSYYVILDGFVTFEQVKICALIAVDEILDMVKHTPIEFIETDWWQEVKKEIENL